MTERLRQLLQDEVGHLRPPAPDAAAVLAEGRRLHRRSRLTTGVAAAAVAAVVVTTASFVALNGGDPGATDVRPAGRPVVDDAPAVYGVGSDVHLDDEVAQVPDTVHSLHYTSVGVLVRSNPNDGASDGSGPESLTLVRWDGSTADLGTVPEGVGPATDPERDVYVLAVAASDGFVAVVRDAETGETLEEVPLPDLPKSYWEVPPLSLDDDTLYVGYKSETVAVDLATGEDTPVEALTGGLPEVLDGRTLLEQRGSLVVRDVTTGDDLLDVDVTGYAWGTLSPDGRFLRVEHEPDFSGGDMIEPPLEVYTVDTGEVQEFEDLSGSGWTADGGLFGVDRDILTTCDAATGECQESPLSPALPKNLDLRIGGRLYES